MLQNKFATEYSVINQPTRNMWFWNVDRTSGNFVFAL